MKNARWVTARYLIFDFLSAATAWALLFLLRKVVFEHFDINQLPSIIADANLWRGIIAVPLGWIALYALQGSYKNVLRKSRLKELQQTAIATLIGTVVLFFALLLDDYVDTRSNYYISLLFLAGVHFALTYGCRLIQTSATVRRVHSRQLGFPTLLIGSHSKAYSTYLDLENQERYSGNIFAGFVEVEGNDTPSACESRLEAVMPRLGTTADVPRLIAEHNIEEVIIAVEDTEHTRIQSTASSTPPSSPSTPALWRNGNTASNVSSTSSSPFLPSCCSAPYSSSLPSSSSAPVPALSSTPSNA